MIKKIVINGLPYLAQWAWQAYIKSAEKRHLCPFCAMFKPEHKLLCPNSKMNSKYGMFSDEGDLEILKIVEEVVKLPLDTPDGQLYTIIRNRLNKCSHGECWDTDVRESLIGEIERITGKELTIYF